MVTHSTVLNRKLRKLKGSARAHFGTIVELICFPVCPVRIHARIIRIIEIMYVIVVVEFRFDQRHTLKINANIDFNGIWFIYFRVRIM